MQQEVWDKARSSIFASGGTVETTIATSKDEMSKGQNEKCTYPLPPASQPPGRENTGMRLLTSLENRISKAGFQAILGVTVFRFLSEHMPYLHTHPRQGLALLEGS